MRHRTSRTIALTLAAATVVMTSACSSSSSPRADQYPGPTSVPTAQQPSPSTATAEASASPFVKPTFSASPLPGGILPAAVAEAPTPPLRALAPGFSLDAFLQHERTTWGINATVQTESGTPSPDESTWLSGYVNKAGDRLSVWVMLNEQHQVTLIKCFFGMAHNAVADQFIDDCARTALPGVNTTAVVAFVDHARSEIADANQHAKIQYQYMTPNTQFGNDSYIFASEPTTDTLSILGADAT